MCFQHASRPLSVFQANNALAIALKEPTVSVCARNSREKWDPSVSSKSSAAKETIVSSGLLIISDTCVNIKSGRTHDRMVPKVLIPGLSVFAKELTRFRSAHVRNSSDGLTNFSSLVAARTASGIAHTCFTQASIILEGS